MNISIQCYLVHELCQCTDFHFRGQESVITSFHREALYSKREKVMQHSKEIPQERIDENQLLRASSNEPLLEVQSVTGDKSNNRSARRLNTEHHQHHVV